MASRTSLALLTSALVLLAVGPLAPADAADPALPADFGGRLLSNLSAPTLAPGEAGPIGFELSNPFPATMTGIAITVEFYAFAPYPGGSTEGLPASAPTLSGGRTNGTAVSIDLATLAAGGAFRSPQDLGVQVSAPAGAPSGTFDLRWSVTFTENGTAYELESRGYFTAEEWARATEGPNGSATLNLSRLGISGVVPETSVLVRSDPWTPVLYAVLGASLVLAAVGGYVAWRRGPGSRSGRWAPPDPQRAARAFGNRRTRDGD